MRMRLCLRPNALHGAFPRPNRHPICGHPPWRSLLTLAIETSCDDTSVAVLDVTQVSKTGQTQAELHFHKKITANNAAFNGVHPLVALESHQENLAILVAEAIEHLPRQQLPDFISATRGPGMRSNLFTGLDTAKGLAVAWSKPLIGVHHMQAHALTPRLVAALEARQTAIYLSRNSAQESFIEDFDHISLDPEFPFLSVLASGGHTLLIQSSSLTENKIMGSTSDIAIGECLDKIARTVLPSHVLLRAGNTMYGALLEKFAFPERKSQSKRDDIPPQDTSQNMSYVLENIIASEYVKKNKSSYVYEVPKNNEEALKRNISPWGWGLNQPLTKGAGGLKSNSMEMSFTGLTTAVERLFRYQRDPTTNKLTNVERKPEEISIDERRDLAEYVMRAAFEHLAGRVILALQHCPVPTVVMAGGVAANSYLRYVLASTLQAHGYGDVKVVFPPPSLCSDNAAMIAWAGIEMYKHGARDQLSIRAIRKWPLDQLLSPPSEKTT